MLVESSCSSKHQHPCYQTWIKSQINLCLTRYGILTLHIYKDMIDNLSNMVSLRPKRFHKVVISLVLLSAVWEPGSRSRPRRQCASILTVQACTGTALLSGRVKHRTTREPVGATQVSTFRGPVRRTLVPRSCTIDVMCSQMRPRLGFYMC